MARRLAASQNELRLIDNLSGSELRVYYRMPTPQEHIRYTNNLTKRKGNKIISTIGETRQLFGSVIISGFRDGDFERQDEKGQWVPMASDKLSPNYREDWKDQLKTHAPDILETLAVRVFEASTSAAQDDGNLGDAIPDDEPHDGEDAPGNLQETSQP